MAKESLMERMAKIKVAGMEPVTMDDSAFFKNQEFTKTDIPIINIAFSGMIDGGISSGITIASGESRTFKSQTGLKCLKTYLDKYENAIGILYDAEYGCTPAAMRSAGIDPTRVLHVPIEHVEQLKFDCVQRLKEFERGDRVFIMIDSLGALASKKEVEDSVEENSAADMSRAKAIRSFFRIVTPLVTGKDLPMYIVNHIYKEQGGNPKYAKTNQGGGTAVTYSANTVFVITRSQEKDGDEIAGWNFNITIDKSRYVKERTKLSMLVTYEGGISKYSGLMDLALECGLVSNAKKGWYAKVNTETGEIEDKSYRLKDTNTDDFWNPIINNKKFLLLVLLHLIEIGIVTFKCA